MVSLRTLPIAFRSLFSSLPHPDWRRISDGSVRGCDRASLGPASRTYKAADKRLTRMLSQGSISGRGTPPPSSVSPPHGKAPIFTR